jgi:NAD(P)-dependent dehydrogenase (short-subunit alcohol dehydrogenase family)
MAVNGNDNGNGDASAAALVTGCSSGIGRATAERLTTDGYTVYATARRPEAIADLAAAGCRTIALDVTDEASMAAAVAHVEAEHGAVAVLVNNAGFGQQGPLEDTPIDAVREQFEVNVFGPMRLCQLVLPAMRRAGAGRIVNVSSMGGRLTFPGGSAYHGSKYALEAVSDVLRWEVAPFGIGVTIVEPGPTLTEYGEAALASMDRAGLDGAGPYGTFTASIRGALEGTFRGAGLEGASTPADVADAIAGSLATDPAPTRVVVGPMAQQLVELRLTSSDEAWDQILETMYQRPTP